MGWTFRGIAALMAGAMVVTTVEAQRRPGQAAPRQGAPAQEAAPAPAGPRLAGGGPAARLLRLREQLQLTDEQVKRLEALAAAPAPTPNRSAMLRAQADLLDAMRGDGNLEAARAALTKASQARNEQVLARLKAWQEARAVLTAQQKQQVDNLMAKRGQAVRARALRGPRGQGLRGRAAPGMRPLGPGPGARGRFGPGWQFGPGGGPGMGPGGWWGAPPPGPLPRQRRGDEPEDALTALHQLPANW
jgi:Spy/CpxP family protein refolding chaperone